MRAGRESRSANGDRVAKSRQIDADTGIGRVCVPFGAHSGLVIPCPGFGISASKRPGGLGDPLRRNDSATKPTMGQNKQKKTDGLSLTGNKIAFVINQMRLIRMLRNNSDPRP
jgi:hypothetical protein